MSIVGTDNRNVVTNLSANPFDSVVAVDTLGGGSGSGIIIAPNHVLTAGHVIFGGLGARVTTGRDVPNLASRTQTPLTAANVNAAANGFNFLVPGFSGNAGGNDIALAAVNQPFPMNQLIGIVAFVDPDDANGFTVTTAGYPALVETINLQNSNNAQFLITDANGNPSVPTDFAAGAFLTNALVQFSATGTIDSTSSDGTFSLSPGIDIEAGQSGSGYWTVLDGDITPRVLGVASYQITTTPGGFLGLGASPGDNFGALITTNIYNNIVAAIEAGLTNLPGNDLPENAIIGSDRQTFLFLTTQSGDDYIVGSFLRERIIGQGGNDRLFGGGADDRLEGGDGVDQALFSDEFRNYDFTITNPSNPAFEFDHSGGTQTDGKDTTRDIEFGVFEFVDSNSDGTDDDGNLFFVPLQVDPDDGTKLKDGPEITPEEDILDDQGNTIGTITVESPAWMFDGDVNYTLTIGSEQNILFNFAYIIDVSGSTEGEPIAQAQAAYQALTQALINAEIAENSEFAVIPFNSDASLIGPIDAPTAISTINGLSAGGGTNFGPALTQAQNFFTSRNTTPRILLTFCRMVLVMVRVRVYNLSQKFVPSVLEEPICQP
ncbi:MAG: VWA domain-containing protein [Leptolyngbyaceae cyanobacterium SM1_4_3]|nr:VWA domain-containing protein [Leptolyngbyaceae cyanobacterium SM1_4_3]